MLVIAGKLICIYKIKLISISQKSCVFSWWLLAVCFLYEPDFNLSVLPAPLQTLWLAVQQAPIDPNVNIWARSLAGRPDCLAGSVSHEKVQRLFVSIVQKDGTQLEKQPRPAVGLGGSWVPPAAFPPRGGIAAQMAPSASVAFLCSFPSLPKQPKKLFLLRLCPNLCPRRL